MNSNFRLMYDIGKKVSTAYEDYFMVLSAITEKETADFATYLIKNEIVPIHPLYNLDYIPYCNFDVWQAGLTLAVLMDMKDVNNSNTWVYYTHIVTLESLNAWLDSEPT